MKNIIALLLALPLLNLPCMAQEKPRVDDSSKYYLTIITHADWAKRPAEKKLIDDISSEPMLSKAQATHFKHITTKDDMYKSRWAEIYPENRLPAIVLQEASGGYYFKGSGKNVPSGPQQILSTLIEFRKMDPSLREKRLTEMYLDELGLPTLDSFSIDPAESQSSDQELKLPRRPRNDDPNPDSYEMFGGKTPIRDSLGSMSYIFLGVIALGFIMLAAVIGTFILYVFLKFGK